MKRLFKLLIAVWCVVAASTAIGLAAPTRVAGRVLNGTRKDAPVAGATVELLRLKGAEGGGDVLATAKTDARGRFDMRRVEARDDDILIARAKWQGYPYLATAYVGAALLKEAERMGETDLRDIRPDQIELPVFDSTTESPPLAFTVHHVAIESEGRDLKCIERIVVENPTRRTFLGAEQGVTIALALPKGARDVALDPKITDARLVKVGKVYGIAKPIASAISNNRNAIIVQYTMPWASGGIDLSRRLLYPVKFFFVARTEADRKLKITAPQLGRDEGTPLPIGGAMQTRIVNSIGPSKDGKPVLEAGTLVTINVSRAVNPLVWAFVAFVGALCLAVPLTLLRGRGKGSGERQIEARGEGRSGRSGAAAQDVAKIAEPAPEASVNRCNPSTAVPSSPRDGARRRSGKSSKAGTKQPVDRQAEVQQWIEKIARLDEQWEAGSIEQNEYQDRRAAWKQKVVELLSAATNDI